MSLSTRLKSARLMRGYSLKELAGLTSGAVSSATLSRFERGEIAPSPDKLRWLARAMELPYSYFFRTPKVINQVAFRKRSKLGKKVEQQILEQTRDFLERYTEAEHLMNIPSQKLPEFSGVIKSLEDAESAADQLRKDWRLGENPIHSVVEEMEAEGIRILAVDAHSAFDGLSSTPDSEEDFIVFNRNQPLDRQRFTLLHELGHHYLKIAPKLDQERAVNRFSGAFAVPASMMRERIGSHRKQLHPVELIGLKKDFGLSIAALLYRAKDLGIITEYAHRNAMVTISQIGWRKNEPEVFIGEEKPSRLLELLGRGIAEECISQSKAAELYGMKLGDFRDVLLQGEKYSSN
ncbi:ImmA/IrrE family metallo-endopeptidase [Lewinella sp. W8]|uniref:helix-turn-helix domain-containing protein n=1 Tax=Lewinella sp. W8 TaxID=2528208 RepID=UPI001068CE23|nr:XRE family transcriptional regulator [Lewinella sp. W8]MTB51862.1 ImmA/IrrE family metallo-endopeptidase [Lewinella sp. W8]